MDGLVFYILFNNITVIIGLRKCDYERHGQRSVVKICSEFHLQCDSNLRSRDPKIGEANRNAMRWLLQIKVSHF